MVYYCGFPISTGIRACVEGNSYKESPILGVKAIVSCSFALKTIKCNVSWCHFRILMVSVEDILDAENEAVEKYCQDLTCWLCLPVLMKSPHPRDRFGPLLAASKLCFRSGLEVQPLCSARTRCKHIWKQRTKLWRNIVKTCWMRHPVLMKSPHSRDRFGPLLAASKICIRSVLEVQPQMSLRVQQEKESCWAVHRFRFLCWPSNFDRLFFPTADDTMRYKWGECKCGYSMCPWVYKSGRFQGQLRLE